MCVEWKGAGTGPHLSILLVNPAVSTRCGEGAEFQLREIGDIFDAGMHRLTLDPSGCSI